MKLVSLPLDVSCVKNHHLLPRVGRIDRKGEILVYSLIYFYNSINPFKALRAMSR